MGSARGNREHSYTKGLYRISLLMLIFLCFIDLRPVGQHRLNAAVGSGNSLVSSAVLTLYFLCFRRIALSIAAMRFYSFTGQKSRDLPIEFGRTGGNDVARWTSFVVFAGIVYFEKAGYRGLTPVWRGVVAGLLGIGISAAGTWVLTNVLFETLFGVNAKDKA